MAKQFSRYLFHSSYHDNFHDETTIAYKDECKYNISSQTFGWSGRLASSIFAYSHTIWAYVLILNYTSSFLQTIKVLDIKYLSLLVCFWNNSFSSMITLILKQFEDQFIMKANIWSLDTKLESMLLDQYNLLNRMEQARFAKVCNRT
jgi:hypothetical protein